MEIAEKEETGVKNRNGDKVDCREGGSISSDPWRGRGGEVGVPVGGRRIQVCLKAVQLPKTNLARESPYWGGRLGNGIVHTFKYR